MEVRRRLPRERSYIHERQHITTKANSQSVNQSSGVINGLIAIVAYLAQLLRSLVYGSPKEHSRLEDDAAEKSSDEELVLLGHMERGSIAVHERRRTRSTALVFSKRSVKEETPSALSHAAAAYAFLASETHPRILSCFTSGPPVVLSHAPLGTLQGFLNTTPRHPKLRHPSIPNTQSPLALPLSWLLQTASALRFLHDSKVTHGALGPSSLYLHQDMSITITNFTRSTINGHNNGIPTREPSTFAFPVDALRYDYFDGELSANSQALGLAIDTFDFATLAYKLLLRQDPQWELPEGNGTWALEELHEALDQAAPELGDEIVVGFVVRDAWCLVYEEGRTLVEDVVHALCRHGFEVEGDEIVGVMEAVKDFAEDYRAEWVF